MRKGQVVKLQLEMIGSAAQEGQFAGVLSKFVAGAQAKQETVQQLAASVEVRAPGLAPADCAALPRPNLPYPYIITHSEYVLITTSSHNPCCRLSGLPSSRLLLTASRLPPTCLQKGRITKLWGCTG